MSLKTHVYHTSNCICLYIKTPNASLMIMQKQSKELSQTTSMKAFCKTSKSSCVGWHQQSLLLWPHCQTSIVQVKRFGLRLYFIPHYLAGYHELACDYSFMYPVHLLCILCKPCEASLLFHPGLPMNIINITSKSCLWCQLSPGSLLVAHYYFFASSLQ